MCDPGVMARNGRALAPANSPSNASSTRQSRSPRPKRRPRTRSKRKGCPIIQQPLSVLTKDYKLPVRDMAAWVHRSVEERLKEVEKKQGYISRPMNSFMLYRSAYADRVKQFCRENNHQVVSQVTGASWPLEPKEIRDLYERYAVIERDNHAAAHPGYKFAPHKNKKRPHADGGASDSDPDWEGSSRSPKRSRTSRRDDSRSMSSTPFDLDPESHFLAVPHYQPVSLHPSSYQLSNPYGPPPLMVGSSGPLGPLYQTTVTPYGQHVDDVKFGRLRGSLSQVDLDNALVGMPNIAHHDLLTPSPVATRQLPVHRDILDPRLTPLDPLGPNFEFLQYEGTDQEQNMARSYAYGQEIAYHPAEMFQPSMATLTEHHNIWAEPWQAGWDFDNEFRKWS